MHVHQTYASSAPFPQDRVRLAGLRNHLYLSRTQLLPLHAHRFKGLFWKSARIGKSRITHTHTHTHKHTHTHTHTLTCTQTHTYTHTHTHTHSTPTRTHARGVHLCDKNELACGASWRRTYLGVKLSLVPSKGEHAGAPSKLIEGLLKKLENKK